MSVRSIVLKNERLKKKLADLEDVVKNSSEKTANVPPEDI